MEVAQDFPKIAYEASSADIVIDPEVTNNLELRAVAEVPVEAQTNDQDASYYTLACNQSLLSRDVDRWIRGSITTETTGVQGSRPTVMQRSIETTNARAALPSTDMAWYMIAFTMMPLLNVTRVPQWRCSHSFVLNAMELGCAHLSTACSRLRGHVRRLAQHQLTRELLATAMDAVLVIYAIGFLLLSVYQTAILT